MQIFLIFAPYLYAFKHPGEAEDEFSRLFSCWTDPEWLRAYFIENNNLLSYEQLTISVAVERTMELADKLYDLLEENRHHLDACFQHLKNTTISTKPLAKQKAKKKWLRLYAVKIDAKHYIITGGAIKQSLEMKDHELTNRELTKLEQCVAWLQENGVFDVDSFFELEW